MSEVANISIDLSVQKKESEEYKIQYDLKKFKLSKILSNNTNRKTVVLLGAFPDLSEDDLALVILEKSAFTEENVSTENDKNYFVNFQKVDNDLVNNIYGSYRCYPNGDLNGIKTTVIYPATPKHIQKYSMRPKFIIKETPELYKEVTLPYLTESQFSLEWVYNILEHKQEVERIVFEDTDPETGFVMVPDLKWDGVTPETLYLLAITNLRNIKSLRDLDSSHIPLLKNIREAGLKAIKEKYGLDESRLRIYFHYQPSFYHLHVHFNPLSNEAPGIFCEKSHLLDSVISNLEIVSDYYKKATLSFVAYEGQELLEIYRKKGVISSPEIEKNGSKSETKENEPEAKKARLE